MTGDDDDDDDDDDDEYEYEYEYDDGDDECCYPTIVIPIHTGDCGCVHGNCVCMCKK